MGLTEKPGIVKANLEQIVQASGLEFRWHVHRQPQWCGADGWKGLCIWVELARNPQRPLLIEFPFEVAARRSTPQRQRPALTGDEVVRAIDAGLAAGWEPTSRGKPFAFAAPTA